MENERILLSGTPIEIADFKEYKLATFLICVCDELDLNGRIIPRESADLYHSSIVGFPIVAKLVCNAAGDPVDFAGHEMYLVTNENGEEEVKFGTHPIGSVVKSWTEDREVAGYVGTKHCIMIQAKLWSTRYPEYFKVLDKLWAANNVKSSWELVVSEAVQTTKGKILKAFSFIGNALLGSSVIGAVPGAGVYEYAQKTDDGNDPEFELAMALSQDVAVSNNQRKEGDADMEETKNTPVEEAEEKEQTVPVDEVSVNEKEQEDAPGENQDGDNDDDTDGIGDESESETASLTDWDIKEKIEGSHQAKTSQWCWVCWLFPAEGKAWIRDNTCQSDTDYILVEYTVNDDEVTIVSETPCKLTVSVAEINDALAARDDAIAKANAKINDLTAEVADLKPYKEAADKAEQERIEQETAEKRKDFKAEMLKTKLFTEEEIETSEELKAMVNNMDEAAFKAEVAERFIQNMQNATETETAEVKTETVTVRHDLSGNDDKVDNATFMRHLLGKD